MVLVDIVVVFVVATATINTTTNKTVLVKYTNRIYGFHKLCRLY